MNKNISDIRKDYIFNELNELSESDICDNPYDQFDKWFEIALKNDPAEANAMFLATSTKEGKPSLRTVLLKGIQDKGFLFFTNYKSRKGRELIENPNAALLFFWKDTERQIRIEGKTEKVSKEDSYKYFQSRPADSQIAALASEQSSIISGRNFLQNKFDSLKSEYHGKEIPLPQNWGGFRLSPDYFEYWQGRQNRLHDRISYTLENGIWRTDRLSP